MLLGLDTSSYQLAAGLGEWRPHYSPPMRLQLFLRKAAELSLAGVAISDLRLLEKGDYGYLSSLRRAAEEAGLFLQLTYAGPRIDHLQDTIRAADALGCKMVCFHPEFERPASAESMQARLEELSDLLAEALPVAERYFIHIALASSRRLTAKEMLHLFQAADSELLGLCLDPASALSVLEDPLEWAQILGPHTFCLRLSDYQILFAPEGGELFSCPLGEGIVDIPGLLEALCRASPEAHLLLTTPSELLSLPFLDEDFLARLHHLRPTQLARMVRLVRERALKEPPLLLQQADLPEDEILAAEDERFQQSLEWVRARLVEPQ